MAQATESRGAERHASITGFHGVRYQVKDVARAVAFYTQHLGFTLGDQQLPAFALVSIGDAHILLRLVVLAHLDRGRCPTVSRRSPAAGIGSS
jgi:catechol 2,3-dioxygenase-like lactoylglutathione lyase family enzyme